MSKNNNFRAPQKKLISSWRDECFQKPKTKGVVIINRSRLSNTGVTIKTQGSFVSSSDKQGYQY